MFALLRSVWDEPRPANPRPRWWLDWAMVGVLVALAVLEAALRSDLEWRVFWAVTTAGLVPTLLLRRSNPLLAVTIAFIACGAFELVTGSDMGLNTMAFMLLLPYSLFRWGSGREAVIGLAIMFGRVCLSLVLGHADPVETLGGIGILCGVCAIGAAVRYRARARMRELDQVKLLEREMLARDLHDTVAHHVSAMAIRAQAGLATAAAHPQAATDALRVIESEAARTLAEMRGMVRVLRRDEPAERAPNPRLGDLQQLAGRDGPGPRVDVELVGDVAGLPPPVSAAIFRLAQESVTNAKRHARHATRIEVRVIADQSSVRLRVRDDGDGAAHRSTPTPGYGLLGMIERAGLLGGTCQAGPDPDLGWTVTAVLPRTG